MEKSGLKRATAVGRWPGTERLYRKGHALGGVGKSRYGAMGMEFSDVTEFGHGGVDLVSKKTLPCFRGAKRAQTHPRHRNIKFDLAPVWGHLCVSIFMFAFR